MLHNCNFCDYSTKQKPHLTRHMETKHFYCYKCKIQETNKKALFLHFEKVHNNIFKCDACGEKLRSKFQLKQHRGKNHSENPIYARYNKYVCDICDYIETPQTSRRLWLDVGYKVHNQVNEQQSLSV